MVRAMHLRAAWDLPAHRCRVTVWLVRHAESVLNAAGVRHRREDAWLTTEGLRQAAEVKVTGRPRIVCSPLLRAYGTACVIAATHGLDAPLVREELGERDWGQSCDDVAPTAAAYLRGMTGDVLAVTHAGVIKGLLGLDKTPPNCSVHEWQP